MSLSQHGQVMQESQPQIPPNLSVDSMNLSVDEVCTYPRWYTDLLLRKKAQSITLSDALNYVANFGLSAQEKDMVGLAF